MSGFKDYFSTQSKIYSKYRPEYPKELYSFLANNCHELGLAWDCATGNGQAARGLCEYFERVHATDASEAQIRNTHGSHNINFQVADAANSGLKDKSVDLITVAQALHWFDLEKFYAEANRVLKEDGLIAVWCYAGADIDDDINPIVQNYYNNIVGKYWPEERKHIENRYNNLAFPFLKIKVPYFTMEIDWTLDHFLGYLESWSATTLYKKKTKKDPLGDLKKNIELFWPDHAIKRVTWPLTLKLGHKRQNESAPKK